jgi:hypothetical protein
VLRAVAPEAGYNKTTLRFVATTEILRARNLIRENATRFRIDHIDRIVFRASRGDADRHVRTVERRREIIDRGMTPRRRDCRRVEKRPSRPICVAHVQDRNSGARIELFVKQPPGGLLLVVHMCDAGRKCEQSRAQSVSLRRERSQLRGPKCVLGLEIRQEARIGQPSFHPAIPIDDARSKLSVGNRDHRGGRRKLLRRS